ncbi:molecular chaperone DnaJ [Kiloniella sp. EL199]|uniref:molecular chaperone DnaJ n=1 Tax=Kiloniella sp. EL199 TaxID=2107581 RepID=UPI000EA155C3|nr:molecular chaperone DnaJ [Kiloniella sp. EL199]
MIAYFILGVGLFFGALFLAQWYSRANPVMVLKTAKIIAAIIGLFVALFLLFTGWIFLVLAAIPFLLPLILRSRALLSRLKAASGGTSGQSSEVVTRFLKMKLDHDSGDMDGLVLTGEREGQWLSELDLAAIEQLYRIYLVEENKSAELLTAYASRRFGNAWNDEAEAGFKGDDEYEQSFDGQMDRKRALEILGLTGTPSDDEIRSAHRRLMQKLHPDHGGNTYLATQVNQAKDTLLNRSG